MLEVQRQSVEAEAQAQAIFLVQAELQLVNDNLNAIATQAAMLVAISFGLFSRDTYDHESDQLLSEIAEGMYCTCAMVGFLALLFVVGGCTVVATNGPRMALTGKETNAVRVALERMRMDEVILIRLMMFGVASNVVAMLLLVHSWHIDDDGETKPSWNWAITAVAATFIVCGLAMLAKMFRHYAEKGQPDEVDFSAAEFMARAQPAKLPHVPKTPATHAATR